MIFAFEFHIPFYALRRGQRRPDSRRVDDTNLRQSIKLPLGQTCSPEEEDFYYEAEVSLLVTGVDEWFWTAYCLVDGYFEPEFRYTEYFEGSSPHDPCTGYRALHHPYWNPREFFLAVLSRRLRQATREWRALIHTFEERMNRYVNATFRKKKEVHADRAITASQGDSEP